MPKKPERVMVKEPELLDFEIWLASNPDYTRVERWLSAIDAYFARWKLVPKSVKEENDGKEA